MKQDIRLSGRHIDNGHSSDTQNWRFSFSVGEKLLIYSFTHVQLMCYALMKILLKDVIDSPTESMLGLITRYFDNCLDRSIQRHP
jgi:hypothetical protein